LISAIVRDALIERLVSERGAGYRKTRFRERAGSSIDASMEGHAPGAAPVFIKSAPVASLDRFLAEARGLELLAQCEAIRVPELVFVEVCADAAVLLLEFVELHPVGRHETRMGEALAELHGIQVPHFGLDHDNYIGATPQRNICRDALQCKQWWHFFCDLRLQCQLELAQYKGMTPLTIEKLRQIIQSVPGKLAHHQPPASLLHGDLWSGNLAVDCTGKPTLFDPAVYFGDAETDIAMSKMFGALGRRVYQVYDALTEKSEGYELRQRLYDLYHWLNHFNLFGGRYLGRAEVAINELVHELE